MAYISDANHGLSLLRSLDCTERAGNLLLDVPEFLLELSLMLGLRPNVFDLLEMVVNLLLVDLLSLMDHSYNFHLDYGKLQIVVLVYHDLHETVWQLFCL